MNGDKKFREIYYKFDGSYGDLILEHIRILEELEKCKKIIHQQIRKKKKR